MVSRPQTAKRPTVAAAKATKVTKAKVAKAAVAKPAAGAKAAKAPARASAAAARGRTVAPAKAAKAATPARAKAAVAKPAAKATKTAATKAPVKAKVAAKPAAKVAKAAAVKTPAKAAAKAPVKVAAKGPVKAAAKAAAPAKKVAAIKAAPIKAALVKAAPVKPALVPRSAPVRLVEPLDAKKHHGPALAPSTLERLREQLLEERARHAEQAAALLAEADELASEREPGDTQFDEESGEGDTLSVERERDLTLSATARQTVDDIDKALARVAAGTYGYCEMCGDRIPVARLEAIPWADLCVRCKSRGERRR